MHYREDDKRIGEAEEQVEPEAANKLAQATKTTERIVRVKCRKEEAAKPRARVKEGWWRSSPPGCQRRDKGRVS